MVVFSEFRINLKPFNRVEVVSFYFDIARSASCHGWAQMIVIVLRRVLHSWKCGCWF